jgi:glycosyltransferase-like protein LARGE
MALPKAVNYFIVVYLVCSILYTSTYLLGFRTSPFKKSLNSGISVASLQQHYLGKQRVDWTNSLGKIEIYFIVQTMDS